MDVREKLVELLNDVQETGVNEIPAGFGCTREYIANEKVASHLTANGVTVQEWISVKDRLPDQSGEVLVIVSGNPQKNITLNFAYELAEYDPYDGWIMEMWPEWEDAVVTHWMPLPLPPKGE